jgi:hypothetical protein
VVATSTADPTRGATAVVVVSTAVVAIAVSPRTVSVAIGAAQNFTCTVTGSTNTACTWRVQEAGGGVIDPATGYYLAPGTPGTYHLVVESEADPTRSDVATITVTDSAQPPVLTGTVSLAVMNNVATRAYLFGHHSIGQNMLAGVFRIAAYGPSSFKVYGNSMAGPVSDFARNGSDLVNGHMNEFLAGLNNDPWGKVVDFDLLMRGGIGARLDALRGVAFLKFNGTDFGSLSKQIRSVQDAVDFFHGTGRWVGKGYEAAMDRLQADFPNVTFVHFTVPLYTQWNGASTESGAYANQWSTALSDEIRATYPANRVADLAEWQATRPDGTRAVTSDGIYDRAGNRIRVLALEYNWDGIHMDDTGENWTAHQLMLFLDALATGLP